MSLFDIHGKETRLKELEEQTNSQDFWSDQENSTKVLQEMKYLKEKILQYWELNLN